MISSWISELHAAIDGLAETLIRARRHLHAHPEVSGQEFETSQYLYQLLVNRKLAARFAPSGRGVIVDSATTPGESRCTALRADIDALRIQDECPAEYRSQTPGVMHACGHDAHTAAVLGAILALDQLAAQGLLPWPVCWRGIFQPAEETGEGALEMIAADALSGVDAIFALHVDPTRGVGRVGMRSGVLTANCDRLEITVTGRGGHAARPHETLDPIATAAQLISSLYLFIPRSHDSQDAVVLTIGQVHGGDNANVIPHEVRLQGTLRTLDNAVRIRTLQHVRQLAQGLAQASGTEIGVSWEAALPSVNNDPALVEILAQAAAAVVGPPGIDWIARPSMGSEDFAHYQQHVPGAMFRLGCASPAVGSSGLHTPRFDVDERALVVGAKILAQAAIERAAPR